MSEVRVKTLEREPFFMPRALARYLSVSERTVYQLLANRRIASYRVEGARRISAKDVDAYLAANRTAQP